MTGAFLQNPNCPDSCDKYGDIAQPLMKAGKSPEEIKQAVLEKFPGEEAAMDDCWAKCAPKAGKGGPPAEE